MAQSSHLKSYCYWSDSQPLVNKDFGQAGHSQVLEITSQEPRAKARPQTSLKSKVNS